MYNCSENLLGRLCWYCILLQRVKAEGLDLVSPSHADLANGKMDTGTGAAGISCCPRWPDPHSWAIIYFIFADKLPERVISDVNMEIDTTSNGPPLSFPVPSPHGEQTWACKIHQSSTAAPTKCYESRIVMHKCLPRVAPFNSETKPCEWQS